MDLRLHEDQRLIQATLERFLEREHDYAQRRQALAQPGGWSGGHWESLGEIGLLSMFQEYDSGQSGVAELIIVMEAFGRSLFCGPFLPTAVMATRMLCVDGRPHRWGDLLEKISCGQSIVVPALLETAAPGRLHDVSTRATRHGTGFTIAGEKCLVMNGDRADLFLVSARVAEGREGKDAIGVFVVDPSAQGVDVRARRAADGHGYCDVTFRDTPIDAHQIVGDLTLGAQCVAHALNLAHVALCAESVGVMGRMLDDTVAHIGTRVQFGKPLSSFQTLRHRIAEMAVALEEARAMAQFSAMAVERDCGEDRDRNLAAARYKIAKSARFVAHNALQLHGGIGMTDESDISHAFRRLTTLGQWFRTPFPIPASL